MKKPTLILTSEFPPLPGGIGNHAYNLSKYLQQFGYNVTVISDYRNRAEDTVFDQQQAFKIVRINRNIATYLNRILIAFSLAKSHQTIIASGKFSLWLGAFLSLFFSNKKYISVIHGSELKAGGNISQRLTRWSLKRFDKHITVSNFTKRKTLEIHPNIDVTVINNGIELDSFSKEIHQPLSQVHLITVGNLTQRKGQQNVIKALPLLKEKFSNIHYHCVGIFSEKERLESLAKQLDITENITFHGALSNDDKNTLLQKSTIFMMLSEQVKNDIEGFGIAVLEANALGLPAVGSINSGVEDAVKDRFSGRLVNPHQLEDIVSAISDIIENYAIYSENAHEWARRFDWNIIIKNYIDLIES